MSLAPRAIIGGVGYRNLRDHSAGVIVTDRLASSPLPPEVVVEDLSYGPVAIVWRLLDEPEGRRFTRAVFVTAVPRPGRVPGQLTAYRWDRVLPDESEIQRCVCDAVTGIILIDNTLVVTRHFGALPDEVAVVEIEPLAHEFGEELSAPVQARLDEVAELVTAVARDDRRFARLPLLPLGERPTQTLA